MFPSTRLCLVVAAALLCTSIFHVNAYDSSPLLGSWNVVKQDDPMAKKVLDFAIQTLQNNTDEAVSHPQLEKAQVQVVAGLKFHVVFKVHIGGRVIQTHDFLVWMKPGGVLSVMSHSLVDESPILSDYSSAEHAAAAEEESKPLQSNPPASKPQDNGHPNIHDRSHPSGGRHSIGGYRRIPSDDPRVQKAVSFAIDEVNSKLDTAEKLTFVEVVRSYVQIVEGLQFKITVELSSPRGDPEVHHFTVWDRFGTLKLVEHHLCPEGNCYQQ